MTEYIDRQAAIEKIRYQGIYGSGFSNEEREDDVVDMIESIPAADVRPVVRGEWRKIGKIGCIFVCSACDKTFPCKTDFCPNCGAMMEES